MGSTHPDRKYEEALARYGDSITGSVSEWLSQTFGKSVRLTTGLVGLGGGVENRTFAFEVTGGPAELPSRCILRVFSPHDPPDRALCEEAIQMGVRDGGLPVPRVVGTETDAGVIGDPFLIMERLPGKPASPTPRWMRKVGELLSDLHEQSVQPVIAKLGAIGVDPERFGIDQRLQTMREFGEGVSIQGFSSLLDWLEERRPPESEGPVTCHCDFAPQNILVQQGRVTGIIDWSARLIVIGDRHADLGTAACASMFYQPAPLGLRSVAQAAVRYLGAKIIDGYSDRHTIDPDKLRWYAIFMSTTLVLWLTLRHAGIPALMRLDCPLGPWGHPDVLVNYLAYIGEETGIPLILPASATST